MPTDPPESFQKITDVLARTLKQAFDEVCPERYGVPLTVRRTEGHSQENTVSFHIEGSTAITLQIFVTVSHVGGNVYDVTTQVENGPRRRFTYSEPDVSGSSLSIAPYLGKKIARHLLDEGERYLGKEMIRHEHLSEE